MGYCLIAVFFFLTGLGGAAAHRHWDAVNALVYATSVAGNRQQQNDNGPATFLVFNDDFARLQAHALSDPDIMGVEQALGSNVAKVAFVSADSASIEKLSTLSFIGQMISSDVSMLCH